MTVWHNGSMDTYTQEDDFFCNHACEVRISGGTIAVSYIGEEIGVVVYEGTEVEPGHFRLTAPSVEGRATLHRFRDDNVLEGWWHEGGDEGMWRITLDD